MHQLQAQFDGAMRSVHLVVPLELCRRDGYRELAWVEVQALQVEIDRRGFNMMAFRA